MTEKVQFHGWLQPDVKAAAQKFADDNGISLNAAVNLLLKQALRNG